MRKPAPYASVDDLRSRDPGLRLVRKRLRENFRKGREPRTQEELGQMLAKPISKQAVNRWRQVPDEHCYRVALLLGLMPYQLRPDIYPRPPRRKSKVKKATKSKKAKKTSEGAAA